MTPDAPILQVHGLEVVYETDAGEDTAVRDVSFSLRRNESLGLVGESGSGKTTVGLAIIHHLPDNGRISAGSIRFDGIELLRLDAGALRRVRGQRMAMVYQDPSTALNPSLRIGEQVAEIYRARGRVRAQNVRRAATEMLERVHLPDASDAYERYPHEFSGGQQQRIVIAMALAMNPDLLILDEPTTGLDVTVEAEILDLFVELRHSLNAAILFISHNISVIARMCDRIGALYAGQLVELGPTYDVLNRPSHPYTRMLLSARIPFGATKADFLPASRDAPSPQDRVERRGCTYASQCEFAQKRCRLEEPPLLVATENRQSRCFFHAAVSSAGLATHEAPVADPVPTGGEIFLEAQSIAKYFAVRRGVVRAVADASLALKRGRILGLVGESGSGKTTTARIIAGLTMPDHGTVMLEGRDVTRPVHLRHSDARRALQMVFQNPDSTLNPEHRVGRILKRTVKKLTKLRGPELDKRVHQVVESVRLEGRHLETFPDELSGGQRQRVAIARAFAANPKVVLCDEPTSALDVSVQASILGLLIELQRKERNSYLFISHDLAVVRYLADEVAVMYLGEVVERGPANRVFEPPHHPYTETLLSAVLTLNQESVKPRIHLRGPVPSLLNRPRGCPFHPRCSRKVGAICEQLPPWQEAPDGHRYRCVIEPNRLTRLQREDHRGDTHAE